MWGNSVCVTLQQEKVTALHLAAFTGSVDCVQHFLSAGAKTFVQSANGDAPLAVATAQGHLGVVSALLDSRAWVDQFNEKGMTALHVACAKGHVELVARLMAANASPSLPAMDVGTPVDLAIALGRVDCLRVLIDHGATDDMSSLLLLAIQAGRTEVIRFLIEAGANIHCIDAMGSTALHVAFKPGATENLELVRFLLDNGLDVNAPDIGGMTPLHAAAICGLPNSVRFLLEAGAHMSCGPESVSPFTASIMKLFPGTPFQEGRFDVLRILIDAGFDVNTKEVAVHGSTPLHCAVADDSTEVAHVLTFVQILLDAGADVNSTDDQGNTPLHASIESYRPEIVRSIIDAGADPCVKNIHGETALALAQFHEGQHEWADEMVPMLQEAVEQWNNPSNPSKLCKAAR
mmetsp:Transcript_62314/g.147679  ORF Transcript_62314/g.147679 Transcript_62314/m.147679 type:complete len:404 (-) Transcript_62314:17-1228(-)